MPFELSLTTVGNVLTRTGGFLRDVCSHSLQPYRGCAFGNALCGVGCYVRHSGHITRGRPWGGFLEVRTNAAESYRANYDRERRWAHRRRARAGGGPAFSIFCSSATDPFVPQERTCGVTRRLLETMCDLPPDELILQTHSHDVAGQAPLLRRLASRCRLRVHVSIESDRDRLPGLPPPACSVERRLAACAALRGAGVFTVATVAPLLPIADPERFFARIGEVADAVVIDHYIAGDGSPDGSRTEKTALPAAMRAVEPRSVTLAYREEIVAIARRRMPGRVGVHSAGFAGQYE